MLITIGREDEAHMLEWAEKVDRRGRASNQNAGAFQQVLHEVFGVSFAIFEATTGGPVPSAGSAHGRRCAAALDPATVIQWAAAGKAVVEPWENNTFRIALVLHAATTPALVAVGVVAALAERAGNRVLEQQRLQAWAHDFSERLRLRDQLSMQTKTDEDLRGQLNGTWKVNLTLGECMQRLRLQPARVTRS